jgi:tRNA-specific 2-thiouridylase
MRYAHGSRLRVVVGLSGGVDSAVAALLLLRAGHAVEGLFMNNWDADDRFCTKAEDYQDARSVCQHLGIPLHRVNFAAEYRRRVFADFLREYAAGRTPNPDVHCNREIKFGVCLRYARRLGADCLATGHYARLTPAADGPALLKGLDPAKDQSYFLHAVMRSDLTRALFPLGAHTKSEVRAIAHEAGLPVHDKPDSTGICFIGERPFREFLRQHLRATPGPILSDAGEVLGEHAGLPFYTLGQRGGLAIGGRAGAVEQPWYVAAKDSRRNALIVVQGHDHPLLFSRALETGPMHWLAPPRSAPFATAARLRHRQADQSARATPLPGGRLRLDFEEPQRAATPGQFAVLYDGERCLGGAVIERTIPLAADSAGTSAMNIITGFPVEVA